MPEKSMNTKIAQIMDMIGDPNIALVLVGNKSDLQQNEREVSREQVSFMYFSRIGLGFQFAELEPVLSHTDK